MSEHVLDGPRSPLRGFPQQFVVAPTVTLALGGLAPERLKLASGLINLMRNLAGTIGLAARGIVLNHNTNLHFLRVAEHLNRGNPAVSALIGWVTAAQTAAVGHDAVQGHASALKILWSLAIRVAQAQAYANAFFVIILCLVFATVTVPLMRKVAAPAGPSSDAVSAKDRAGHNV